jgi:hypothetical protein
MRHQLVAGFGQDGDGVDHQAPGFMLPRECFDAHQETFGAATHAAGRDHTQNTAFEVAMKTDSDRLEIADYFAAI